MKCEGAKNKLISLSPSPNHPKKSFLRYDLSFQNQEMFEHFWGGGGKKKKTIMRLRLQVLLQRLKHTSDKNLKRQESSRHFELYPSLLPDSTGLGSLFKKRKRMHPCGQINS